MGEAIFVTARNLEFPASHKGLGHVLECHTITMPALLEVLSLPDNKESPSLQ